MKRKILSLLLILTLIISASPLIGLDFNDIFTTAFAAETEFVSGDYNCKIINETEIEITDYLGSDIDVVIPAEINGMPVTSIGKSCFGNSWSSENKENKDKIESINVPSTVTNIGIYAFERMNSLKKIVLGEGVKTIKDGAFEYCPKLESVNLPESLTSLSDDIFRNCTSLKEITLPGKDITYSSDVFYGSSLEKINLSEGMTKIPDYFFEHSKVTTVTVPSTVTQIGAYAFKNGIIAVNQTVETVIFPHALTIKLGLADEEDYQFMLKKNSPALKNVYFRHMPVNMPHLGIYDVSYDEASGYWNCALSEDYSSYEVYNDAAFDYILNENGEAVLLKYTGYNTYVVLPKTVGFAGINYGVVTEIGSDVFSGTYAQKVIIPDNIKKIGSYAFRNSDVTAVEIPESVTEIGNGAFYGCESLESLVLPETVTQIGADVFRGCSNLKNVNWPSKVNYVPAGAFMNCKSFNDFGIFENVEIISGGAFKGCGSLVIDSFGDNLREIGDFAFSSAGFAGDSGIHATVNTEILPEGLEYIGVRAFLYNKTFKKMIIPASIKHIGICAFAHSSLEEVELPDNLKEISEGAFSITPLKSIDLPPNLEKIGNGAFLECVYLEGIEIPDSVTYIGDGAFKGCDSITEIHIPEKLETISEGAFSYLGSITEIHIPSTVKTVGERAFSGCVNVIKITIENGVKSIGNYAFTDNRIKEITIPESVRELGYGIIDNTEAEVVYYNAIELDKNLYRSTSSTKYALFDTISLKKIVFGKNVKLVPASCAYDCDSLEQIVFSSIIREIDLVAFAYCDSLKYIAMPGGVQKIDNGAFWECTSLETAVIPNTVTEIHEYTFTGCENLTIVCTKSSYAYNYAVKNGIKVRVTDTQINTNNRQPESKKETENYFDSFFKSIINKFKEFFAQFTIISR